MFQSYQRVRYHGTGKRFGLKAGMHGTIIAPIQNSKRYVVQFDLEEEAGYFSIHERVLYPIGMTRGEDN